MVKRTITEKESGERFVESHHSEDHLASDSNRTERANNHYWGPDYRPAGYNISWGAILAGVATFLGLNILFSTLGSAIGLGMIDLTSNNLMQNADTAVGIWSIIALLISFAAAGLVSGIAGRRTGWLHGFLTWATSLIASVVLIGLLLSSILSAAGSVASSTANLTGDAIGAGANAAGNTISSTYEGVANQVQNANLSGIDEETQQLMRDTGIEELQPEYISNQLNEAGSDIASAGQEAIVNPNQADQIIDDLLSNLQNRAETISQAADETAIANALQENTNMNQTEAEQAANNITTGLQNATSEAEQALNDAQNQIEQTRQDLQQQFQDLRSQAEDTTNTASKASIWTFIGLLLSAIISTIMGLVGAKLIQPNKRKYE